MITIGRKAWAGMFISGRTRRAIWASVGRGVGGVAVRGVARKKARAGVKGRRANVYERTLSAVSWLGEGGVVLSARDRYGRPLWPIVSTRPTEEAKRHTRQ